MPITIKVVGIQEQALPHDTSDVLPQVLPHATINVVGVQEQATPSHSPRENGVVAGAKQHREFRDVSASTPYQGYISAIRGLLRAAFRLHPEFHIPTKYHIALPVVLEIERLERAHQVDIAPKAAKPIVPQP